MTTSTAAPHKIGFLNEGLFPPGEAFDQGLGRALQLRFDEALERGEIDRPIEIIEAFGAGLPNGHAYAVEQAWLELADAGVLAILGPGKTDNCIAVKHLFEEHGVPTINFPGTTKSRGEYGFHYQLGALYEDGPVIVRALVAKGLTDIAVIRDKSPVGNEYHEYFLDACDRLGVTITADVKISPIATDLSSAVSTAKSANPKALVYLGFGAVLLEMSRELTRQSWDVPRFTTTAGLHFYSKTPQEKEDMSGWAFVDMVDEDNLELQHMVSELKSRYGIDGFSTTMGCMYDMATLTVLGLYYAPVYTPEGMKEGLERIHHIPAALGAQGTVMGFGPHERTALKGPDYLVLRQMQGQVTVRYR